MNAAHTDNHKQMDANAAIITIHKVGMDKPWAWLMAGIRDFRQATAVSLAYGMFWVGLSLAVTAGAFVLGLWHWLLPLTAGFMFLGPLVAVGSYGISRQLQDGRSPNLGDAFGSWTSHTGQLAMMGLMMSIFFLVWIRVATLLFALFFGYELPSLTTLYVSLLTTPEGLGMLAVGTMAGAILAFGAFTISVVAIPTLMDHDLTFMEGIEASIRSVVQNFRPMLLWAVMLTACVLLGVLTFYIGLAIVLPILGHASWHAYEDLVKVENAGSS